MGSWCGILYCVCNAAEMRFEFHRSPAGVGPPGFTLCSEARYMQAEGVRAVAFRVRDRTHWLSSGPKADVDVVRNKRPETKEQVVT